MICLKLVDIFDVAYVFIIRLIVIFFFVRAGNVLVKYVYVVISYYSVIF